MKLAFEKEVLGIYVSGHPLEEYEAAWRKKISNTTADFAYDEEVQGVRVKDGAKAVIGGLISGKTIKYTKDNKIMAFLTIEDLVGTVEVIVFPKTYEQSASFLTEDAKVFVQGRISVEEDKDGKLICEKIVPFTELKKKVWIKFPDMEAYKAAEAGLMDTLRESEGKDGIVIYIAGAVWKGKCHSNGFLIGKKQFSRYNVKNISKKSLKIARKRVKIEEIV